MTNLSKVTQEGVEFFTVQATGASGFNQTGLAELAGVSRQSVIKIEQTLVTSAPSECLKPFVGVPLTLVTPDPMIDGKLVGNLKIYRSAYSAAFLQHYAQQGNQIALFSLLKFAEKGIEAWIQGITGWTAKPQIQDEYAEQHFYMAQAPYLQQMLVGLGVKENMANQMLLSGVGEFFPEIKKLTDFTAKQLGIEQAVKEHSLNPTELGQRLDETLGHKVTPQGVNAMLENLGYQEKKENKWRLTESGKEFGSLRPYSTGKHSDYQILWSEAVLEQLAKPKPKPKLKAC